MQVLPLRVRLLGRLASLFLLALVTSAVFASAQGAAQEDYRLDTGDSVRVTVFGEGDLSGEFKVDDTGKISLPLIGEVKAEGRTASELETAITDALRPDYLISPNVTIEVLNYRPFFIMGEVRNPGSYPYVSGISVMEAVALAGGFTYRARTNEVFIKRAGAPGEEEKLLPVETEVLPGDVIRVRERFF